MYYKLSAVELELLGNRRKILQQFQESQETRRKSLKPPILVVPYEDSDLVCFITRDEEYDDIDSSQVSTDDEDDKLSGHLAQLRKFCRRLCSFIKGRFSRPVTEVKVHDRSIKKHQKRLSSGAATRIPYPGLSEALSRASGTLIGTSLQLQNYQDSVLSEIVPLLGTKCDVCVLSEETQVFRLVDAILESNLWPLAEEDLEEEEEILEESEKETEIGGQEVCNLTCNSVIQACNSYTGTWPYHATSNDDTIGTNDNIEAEAATHFYIDDNYYDKEPPKL